MKTLLIITVAIALSGCSTTWSHKYKDTQDFYRDSSNCEAMSYSAGNGQIAYGGNSFANGYNRSMAIGAVGASRSIFNGCMKGQGWYLVR